MKTIHIGYVNDNNEFSSTETAPGANHTIIMALMYLRHDLASYTGKRVTITIETTDIMLDEERESAEQVAHGKWVEAQELIADEFLPTNLRRLLNLETPEPDEE